MRRSASAGEALSGSVATSTSGTMTSRAAVSPRSKILSIISASVIVTSASSGSICSSSLSSSRETNWRCRWARATRASARPTRALAPQVSGARTLPSTSTTGNRMRIRPVARSRATAFGITSPKTSMSGVRAAVTRKAAPPPITGMSAQVATLDAVMWAMVTPIMAVERRRSGLRNASR